MSIRRPELLVMVLALLGTLAVASVLTTDLLSSRESTLEAGERRVGNFSQTLGEHMARTMEAVDLLLREIAVDLAEDFPEWRTWSNSKSWDYLARRHSRNLPQLRDVALFDADGQQHAISTYFPSPQINVRDRPYFAALRDGDAATTYGPYISRNAARYTYALARRIENPRHEFTGAILGAFDPGYFQEFCWRNRLDEEFESVVMNSRGYIVATCRPGDLSKQSLILGALAVDVLYGGDLRGWLPSAGQTRRNRGLIASVAAVPGFSDLYVLTVLPEDTLLAPWTSQRDRLSLLGALVAFMLLAGGLLVRRQIKETNARAEQLREGRNLLEERVRAATAELSSQKEEAERSNRAKSRFLAAASHDLRQPLHALALFAADLQRQIRSGKTTDIERLSDQIATSTQVLGEMLDSLLDISRLDVAGISPEIRAFPLNPLFDRLEASFRRAALDRNQRLIFRPTAWWCESDSAMVERMLANLIANALRYTQADGCILIAARHRGRKILIEVRDNGPGIAPEHQAAIFGEFYQVDNPAREHGKGLGLGLSIVDRLAHALNIDIRLASVPGKGTVFGLEILAGLPRVEINTPPRSEPQIAIHFVGDSSELRSALALTRSWNYTASHQAVLGSTVPAFRQPTIIVTVAPLTEAVRSAFPPGDPVIILGDRGELAAEHNCFPLPIPLRPAKLRALIGQLQKMLLKSMP